MDSILNRQQIDFYTDKRILITGASGFVGGAILKALSRVDCRLVIVSRKSLSPMTVKGELRNVIGDLNNVGDWAHHAAQCDVIFHMAAQTSVYVAYDDPCRDLRVNVLGLLELLAALRGNPKPPHVVVAGTVTQCGLPRDLPVDESYTDRPVSFYDASKLTAEHYLRLFSEEGSVTSAFLRLANVYGPGTRPSMSDRGVLNKVTRLAYDGKPVSLFGHGAYTRDFIFIDDVVSAFLAVGAEAQRVDGGHFITASGAGTLLRDAFAVAVDCAAKRTGTRVAMNEVEWPDNLSPIEFRNFIGDPSKLKAATGWAPKFTLEQGINRLLDSFEQD